METLQTIDETELQNGVKLHKHINQNKNSALKNRGCSKSSADRQSLAATVLLAVASRLPHHQSSTCTGTDKRLGIGWKLAVPAGPARRGGQGGSQRFTPPLPLAPVISLGRPAELTATITVVPVP
nr:unnamed protein product [Callosobruchus chinensis]